MSRVCTDRIGYGRFLDRIGYYIRIFSLRIRSDPNADIIRRTEGVELTGGDGKAATTRWKNTTSQQPGRRSAMSRTGRRRHERTRWRQSVDRTRKRRRWNRVEPPMVLRGLWWFQVWLSRGRWCCGRVESGDDRDVSSVFMDGGG
ncbi:hypothetical protein PIB30_035040 [Stylosanthes scabra]|uniref:Uncharacterized protein n=1 Tax=Stylosanthes scabra TaxID=79078 RepID=A0ABU6WE67_9FABA|nr:hypothetical protein [Stylosanthes scabra]